MNKILLGVTVLFALLGHVSSVRSEALAFDEWFDSYGKVSWDEERARLNSLAAFLKKHPDMVAYIAYCGENSNDLKRKSKDAERAKKHLIRNFSIGRMRVTLVNGQTCDSTLTILQPVKKGTTPPKFF